MSKSQLNQSTQSFNKSQTGKSQQGKNNKKGGKGKDTQPNEYDKVVAATNIARGKHAKIRKMKNKYADQDEEERQMRMALTGSKDVTGFDIKKHQEYKLGQLINGNEDGGDVNFQDIEEGDQDQEQDDTGVDQNKDNDIPDEFKDQDDDDQPAGDKDEESKIDSDEKQVSAAAASAAKDAGESDTKVVKNDDEDDEAEIAKLIKEEDINLVPENTDVTEIDKLTGVPKQNGKCS